MHKTWQDGKRRNPKHYHQNSHANLTSFWYLLAMDLHDLLGIPLSKTRRPVTGFKIIRAVCDSITAALRRGESVTIMGFGRFEVVERRPRNSGNRGNIISGSPFLISPSPIHYAPRKWVVFRPGLTLRQMVREGATDVRGQ